jgi:hypothetical protein
MRAESIYRTFRYEQHRLTLADFASPLCMGSSVLAMMIRADDHQVTLPLRRHRKEGL